MYKYIKYFAICITLLLPLQLSGQTPSKEEQESKLNEEIDRSIEHYQDFLKLEDWQVFYLDSIFRHDYFAMNYEMIDMQKKGISSTDLFYMVQDKWQEKIYLAVEKVLTPEQWAKYLKSGAARDKKMRDKRAEKRK